MQISHEGHHIKNFSRTLVGNRLSRNVGEKSRVAFDVIAPVQIFLGDTVDGGEGNPLLIKKSSSLCVFGCELFAVTAPRSCQAVSVSVDSVVDHVSTVEEDEKEEEEEEEEGGMRGWW